MELCIHVFSIKINHSEVVDIMFYQRFDAMYSFLHSSKRCLASCLFRLSHLLSQSKKLKAILSTIKWGQASDEVLLLGMQWSFNVPKSPLRTSAVESMIKQVKLGLKNEE